MSERGFPWKRACRIFLRLLVWGGLSWAALHAGATFLARWSHPFQLEWSEGSTFLEALRFAREGVVYSDPWKSLFIPHLYTPLHPVLLGCLLEVFPPGLALGRAFSLAATAVFLFFLERTARAAGASRGRSWAAPLLLLGLAPAVDYWFDLVRVDMLFAALFGASLWALLAALSGKGGRRALPASALLLVGAFLAKQTALAYGPAFFLVLWAALGFRRAFRWGLWAGGALAGSILLLQAWSGGWFWYYAFSVLGRHPSVESQAKWASLGASLLPLLPLLAAGQAGWVSGPGAAARRALAFLTLWGFPFAAYAFLKHGGFTNAWIPLFATALPLAAAAPGGWGAFLSLPAGTLSVLLLLVPLLPFGWFRNGREIPLPGDRKAQEEAVAWIRRQGKRTWCPDNVWITFKADGEILPLLHLVGELMEGDRLPGPLEEALKGRAFQGILFSENTLDPAFRGRTSWDLLQADPRFRRVVSWIRKGYDLPRGRRIPWPSPYLGYPRVGVIFRPAVWIPRKEDR